MQENQITLVYGDYTPPASPSELILNRAEETVNRTTYEIAGSHSLVAKDIVQLYRTYPKRAGNSRGNAKCAIKFTNDISVPNADGSGEIVLPLIGEQSFSIPVGATAGQILTLRQRMIAALIHSLTESLCANLNI